jgi:hypothetical protein
MQGFNHIRSRPAFGPFLVEMYFVCLLHEQYHVLFIYVPPLKLLNRFVSGVWVDMLDGSYTIKHSSEW